MKRKYIKYHYKCTNCGTRHPSQTKECFVCGKSDTITFQQITNNRKNRSRFNQTRKISIKL